LDADAEADQLERAREARLGGGGSDILLGRYIALLRQRHEVAELLVRQQAVEIGLAGNAQVKRAAAGLLASLGEGAAVPVDPRRLVGVCRRHAIDRLAHHLPLAGAQRGARAPREVAVFQLGKVGARVPLERALVVLARCLVADQAPQIAQLRLRESLAERAVERSRRTGRVA